MIRKYFWKAFCFCFLGLFFAGVPLKVWAQVEIPGKVTLKEVKLMASNQVLITWKKTENADIYRIYYRSGSDWEGVVNVDADETSYLFRSCREFPLKGGRTYYFTVRPYNIASKSFGAYHKKGKAVQIPPAKVKLLKVTNSGRTNTIHWKKAEGATHYCIYYKKKGEAWKRIETLNGNTGTSYQHITSDEFPLKAGSTYIYTVRAYNSSQKLYGSYDKNGLSIKMPKENFPLKGVDGKRRSTLKKLLLTGLEPVGTTVYVWGGGWNEADTGAGKEARNIGVSTRWKTFFLQQTAAYDYRNTRYQIHDGLDCSGFIGWCIYNIRNVSDGKTGYVMLADKMAKNFADRGWGMYRASWQVTDYQAGDIMSSSGHVYMVVGQCVDGSVVLLHSSPPGVQLCGTCTPSGNMDSQAVKLASTYMKKYYPLWYAKFPNCVKGMSYLEDYAQMRWKTDGSSVMTDPEGYRKMNAKQILADLFA